MFKLIQQAMPFLTEVLLFILTLAVFTTMYHGELDKSLIFILLILGVELEKIADALKKE